MLLTMKVQLSAIPAYALQRGECFSLQPRAGALYTILGKRIKGDNVTLHVVALSNSRPEYLALESRMTVYLIAPRSELKAA